MGSRSDTLSLLSPGNELSVTLFEEAGDALFLFDPDTEDICDVNPMGQRLSGFTRTELLRLQITYMFRSEIQGGLQRLRHAYKKTGVFHSQEGFLLRHQQEEVWIPVNLTVTRLHAEPKTLGLVTARDIREQREVYSQLQRVDAELRRVLSSVSDFVWSAEVDGSGRMTYRYYSPVVEQVTGRPPEYFLASPERWLGVLHTADRAVLHKAILRIKGGHSTCEEAEYRILRPDGAVRWIRDSIRASRNGNESGLRLDGVVTDITKNREAQARLRESEERFRQLVENSTDLICETDSEVRFTYLSPNYQDVLGYEPGELLGRKIFDLVHPDDFPAVLADLSLPNATATVYRFRHKDG